MWLFCLCTLHYRKFDLVLVAVETVVRFSVVYRASVGLGTVLLQTSPEKGLARGRMEAFLRAMNVVGLYFSCHSSGLTIYVDLFLLFRSKTALKFSTYPHHSHRTYGNQFPARRSQFLLLRLCRLALQPMAELINRCHTVSRSDDGVARPSWFS